MKLTPWIEGHLSPRRVGVYERQYRGANHYSHWNGEFWGKYCACKERAAAPINRDFRSAYQGLPWRGLAEQPK